MDVNIRKAVGEFFVIQAEQLQDCGVEIRDGNSVLDGVVSEFFGGPISRSSFGPTTGHPQLEGRLHRPRSM